MDKPSLMTIKIHVESAMMDSTTAANQRFRLLMGKEGTAEHSVGLQDQRFPAEVRAAIAHLTRVLYVDASPSVPLVVPGHVRLWAEEEQRRRGRSRARRAPYRARVGCRA